MSGIIGSAGSKSGVIGTTELDYEEGEWDATFSASTSGTITINSTTTKGSYTKIGRMIHIQGYFAVSSVSSPAPAGHLKINGLPFTVANDRDHLQEYSAISTYYANLTSGVEWISAVPEPGTNYIIVWEMTSTTPTVLAENMQASSIIVVGGCYEI